MDKNIIDKLKKIKALAENGIGGEKTGAIELYNKLLAKYELSDSEVTEEEVERHWLRFKSEIEKRLLIQIAYKVTGDPVFWEKTDKRNKIIGIECTEFELDQIQFYYSFYKEHLKEELELFMSAFFNTNNLFPDETARCYLKAQELADESDSKRDLAKIAKIMMMSEAIDKKTPNLQIGMNDDEDEDEYDNAY